MSNTSIFIILFINNIQFVHAFARFMLCIALFVSLVVVLVDFVILEHRKDTVNFHNFKSQNFKLSVSKS